MVRKPTATIGRTKRKPADSKLNPALRFSAALLRPKQIQAEESWIFLRIPEKAGRTLPSRGQVSVEGSINGVQFAATLQPDGRGGHWLKIENALCASARLTAGDTVRLEISPSAEEPEPTVPADFRTALAEAAPKARAAWAGITPAARRDFIHWITSPKRPETRVKRIGTACDMLAKGKRRPCCFDRSGMYDKSLSCPVAEGE